MKFDKLIQSGEFVKKEVLFLGYHMFENNRDKFYDIYNIDIQPNNFFIETLNRQIYIGGYFAYSINKNGAQRLINYITKNGIKSIKEYNITDVVDLRSNIESKNLGYGHASELKIHSAPMIKDSSFISNVGVRLGRKHEYENYLKEGRKSFKILFAAINNAAGAVYLHCAVGKDRTGVVSSVLLMALGVSREDILKDYIYSKQSVKLILPSLASSGVYNDFANPNWSYQIPKADDISHIIDFIGDQAGALSYLTSCGISKKEISAFNSKFLS